MPLGRYLDLKGRRKVLTLGIFAISVLTASISVTKNVYLISIIHGAMGVCAVAVAVSSLTMITDLTAVTNRGVGMGAFDTSNIVGYAMGIGSATFMLRLTGDNFGLAFVLTGALLFAVALASIMFVRETAPSFARQDFLMNPLAAL